MTATQRSVFRCGCEIAWDGRGVSAFHLHESCPKRANLRGTYRDFKAMALAFARAHKWKRPS